jgi:cyanophycinase
MIGRKAQAVRNHINAVVTCWSTANEKRRRPTWRNPVYHVFWAMAIRYAITHTVHMAIADSADIAQLVEGAGLIYLSGGHPGFLAETLRDTVVWAAIVEAWRNGAALAGCSAGAMAFSAWVPSLRHPREGGTPGLGLLPHVRAIPHFDAFVSRIPDMMTRFLLPHDPAIAVLGVDEETALVGGTSEWVVKGKSSAWRLTDSGREQLVSGSTVITPL